MTKGERKKAIALALTRIEVAEAMLNEAWARFEAKQDELDNMTWHIYGAYLSEIRPYREAISEYEQELWRARLAYNELTKCKAWKNL